MIYALLYCLVFWLKWDHFNIRLNNQRKDPNALPASKHFTLPGHYFINNAKITLTKMLTNSNEATTETLK